MKLRGFLIIFLLPIILFAQEPYFVLNDPNGHYSAIGSLMLTDDKQNCHNNWHQSEHMFLGYCLGKFKNETLA